jgi:hypothetical protein
MTDPGETGSLVDQILGGYREHAAEESGIAAVPGRVLGSDVEGQADVMAAAAARLAGLLAAFGQEPRRSMDAIAVLRGLSRAAESMTAALAELRRQGWVGPDKEDPETAAAWKGALRACRPPWAPSGEPLTADLKHRRSTTAVSGGRWERLYGLRRVRTAGLVGGVAGWRAGMWRGAVVPGSARRLAGRGSSG